MNKNMTDMSSNMTNNNNNNNIKNKITTASKHSSDRLHIPIASYGLSLNYDAVRIAVGLRLGDDICQSCMCCYGTQVEVIGSHALLCKRSSGQLIRHII